MSLKTAHHLHGPEELSEILRQYNLESDEMKKHLGSGALTQTTFDSENNIVALLKKIKEQEITIEGQKAKEQAYKDKIFELEKKLKESEHKLELQKLESQQQVSKLEEQLKKKNDKI